MIPSLRKFFTVVPVFLTLLSAPGLWAQDSGDPPARVGRLSSLRGQVSLQPSGANQWSEVSTNYPVASGDRLYADQDGQAEVEIGEIVTRLWHNTDLSMTNISDEMVQLGLSQGTLRLRTYGLQSNEDVEIDTPNGAVTVIQAGDIRVDSYPGDAGTIVTVNTGQVQISGPGLEQYVNQGQSVRLIGSNPIQVTNIEMASLDSFDHWSMDRDRHLMNASSARYVSRDVPGYADLDDYGDWDPQSDYGPVWYPRAVPAGWVPYRYGHWVWTGPWGWTWVEDEPWGYAPFHYGRWVYLRNRWGWVPGPVAVRPVWSPALVAFVGGPSFSIGVSVGGGPGVSAWFPLGPGEPYNPWYHCSPRYVNQVNITNIHVTKVVVVQNNYNITNINNVRYNYRTTAVTAVPSNAFATARRANENLVRIDAARLQQAQVVARPEIRPTPVSIVAHPVVRVPVPVAHPVLLTQGGRQMQAVPGARPQPVPVRPIPPTAIQGQAGVRPGNVPSGVRPVNVPAPISPVARPVMTQPTRPVITPPTGVRTPVGTAPAPRQPVAPPQNQVFRQPNEQRPAQPQQWPAQPRPVAPIVSSPAPSRQQYDQRGQVPAQPPQSWPTQPRTVAPVERPAAPVFNRPEMQRPSMPQPVARPTQVQPQQQNVFRQPERTEQRPPVQPPQVQQQMRPQPPTARPEVRPEVQSRPVMPPRPDQARPRTDNRRQEDPH